LGTIFWVFIPLCGEDRILPGSSTIHSDLETMNFFAYLPYRDDNLP
jgi:hypothetical protein